MREKTKMRGRTNGGGLTFRHWEGHKEKTAHANRGWIRTVFSMSFEVKAIGPWI